MNPLLLLAIGLLVVVGMILVLRLNAFIALITAALLLSLLSPGEASEKVSRVAEAFGAVVGGIGIVIALAAVIGKCLMDSGAADRIVRSFLGVLGEKRAASALMFSGFVLSIPVFFDTVFYLLIPLARSLCRRTGKNYVLYITAMVAGGAITHSLVPPTPGPLAMANSLGVDLGRMILVGCMVGFPSSIIGLLFCGMLNRFVDIPMRPYSGEAEPEVQEDPDLPPLWLSLLPVLLPVVLIGANTVTESIVGDETSVHWAAGLFAILGNPNMALFISAVIAMVLLVWHRRISLKTLGQTVDTALMSGGMIILITAAGGAFGAMLRAAGIQGVVEGFIGGEGAQVGVVFLLLGFAVASVIKMLQGSGTVSMITTSSMFAAMEIGSETLGCHMVYLATAIGSGSLVGDWMNNSGFWIFARMSVLTEMEGLKTWTLLTAVLGLSGLGFTLVFAKLVPMI